MAEFLVNIDVDDLERGIDFYARGLGLTLGRRFGPQAVEMLGASSPFYLLEKRAGTSPFAGAPFPREYRRHWTPVHLDVAVGDLETAIRRAESAGAKLESEIQEFDWGRIAKMADPLGHGFCILQFKGRGYGEIVGEPSE